MSSISRFFLVAEGTNNTYPNYTNTRIHFLKDDPADCHFEGSFICSPLFCLGRSSYSEIPQLSKITKISFIMAPTIFPNITELWQDFPDESIWFSLGLANIVVLESSNNSAIIDNILNKLIKTKNIIGYEVWDVKNGLLINDASRKIKLFNEDQSFAKVQFLISDKLPLDLKFATSEFILSVNKLLKSSKKFTPQYYKRHEKVIEIVQEFVSDLAFLYGDERFAPSQSTILFLDSKTSHEAFKKISQKEYLKKVKELINDRHGKIIQFNSSLSYIYSQAYSGTFPLFDHVGIVRRHSLLGLGTAISALYELMIQLESAFNKIPFEDILESPYYHELCPHSHVELIMDLTSFNPQAWKHDDLRARIAKEELSTQYSELPIDSFNRLSFFSGRLGFREYDFGATAAIQVVVEAHTLPWHIINYTHEIIHSQVRYLLKQLIMVPNSSRIESKLDILEKYITKIEGAYGDYKSTEPILSLTYYDYFVIVLLKFVINASVYGALSIPCDSDSIDDAHYDIIESFEANLPDAESLLEWTLDLNKDITEIFVHVLDFNYIYKNQLNVYMMSIWTSWSTIPSVATDLKQYILRSLIIVALGIEADSKIRFEQVILKFKRILTELSELKSNIIFTNIISVLDNSNDLQDLEFRFYNCVIVGDLVNNFFVGKLESYLDNKDRNIISESIEEDGIPVTYAVKTNSFDGDSIRSKVRFLLDQLIREVYKSDNGLQEDLIERTSAWLLLSLSSLNYD